jgi:hypothetical protein
MVLVLKLGDSPRQLFSSKEVSVLLGKAKLPDYTRIESYDMNNFVWHVLYKSLNRNNFDNSVNEK